MNLSDIVDRTEISDAVTRFANGMDTDDPTLLASAFSEDAVVDFSSAAEALGVEFPVLTGREEIAKGLGDFTSQLTTSYSVGNLQIAVEGDAATVYALVEAQHLPAEADRMMLVKNRYDITARRTGDGWRIDRLTAGHIWSDGDVSVLTDVLTGG